MPREEGAPNRKGKPQNLTEYWEKKHWKRKFANMSEAQVFKQ